jgi:hypothetical protein
VPAATGGAESGAARDVRPQGPRRKGGGVKLKLGEGLQIPIEVAGQAVALVGIRGSGKTNTAGVIAEELLDRGQQIVVLDPTDAWWGLRSDYPVFIFGGPHGDLALNETDGKTLAEFVVQEKVPIILSLRHLRKGAQRRLIMEFCEELYHLKGKPEYREPLTVFIDEAPQFVPQRVMGEMARLVGAVQDMILLGRNVGFGVVLISQRFATLNADVRTQADTVIVHRLPSPLDRKALTEWIEENATIAEQKEVLSSLAKLNTGEAWMWSPYFDLFKRAQIRPRKTFDSSAAPKQGAPARAPKDLTKVDLEKLKGKLAATIEKAKADDPRELRKQLAEKAKRISELEKATSGFASSNERTKHEVKTVEKFVLKDGQLARLEKIYERVLNEAERHAAAIELFWKQQSDEAKAMLNVLALVAGEQKPFRPADVVPLRQPTATTTAAPPRSSQARRVAPASGNERRPARLVSDASSSGALPKMHRAMLIALAQHPEGLTKKQILVHTGYASSGPVSTAFADLARDGFVAAEGNRLQVTRAGLAALGPFDPLPLGDELREWLLSGDKLSTMEKALLSWVCDAYPNAISKGDVLAKANYASSGPVSSAFAKLVAYNYVIPQGPSMLKAAEELFS